MQLQKETTNASVKTSCLKKVCFLRLLSTFPTPMINHCVAILTLAPLIVYMVCSVHAGYLSYGAACLT